MRWICRQRRLLVELDLALETPRPVSAAVLDAAVAADHEARDGERQQLELELRDCRSARGRHAGERDRVVAAIGAGAAPQGLVARVGELDGLVAEADERIGGLEQDLAALAGTSDTEALKSALEEFDGMWGVFDQGERAKVLALVLNEVVVDGGSGDAELRFRGARSSSGQRTESRNRSE